MKTAKMKFFIVALAVMMFPAFALAQALVEDTYISPLSIRLVQTSNIPGVIARNDNGTRETPRDLVYGDRWTTRGIYTEAEYAKLTKTRITNQTILAMLVEAGAIPAVRGSQLALMVSHKGFRAVVIRRGEAPIFVNEYLGVGEIDQIVARYKYDYKENEVRFSKKESATYKGVAAVEINIEGEDLFFELNVHGAFEMSTSYRENESRERERFLGGKITSIVGESRNFDNAPDDDDDDDDDCFIDCRNFVQGSITIGNGRFYAAGEDDDDDDDDDDVIDD